MFAPMQRAPFRSTTPRGLPPAGHAGAGLRCVRTGSACLSAAGLGGGATGRSPGCPCRLSCKAAIPAPDCASYQFKRNVSDASRSNFRLGSAAYTSAMEMLSPVHSADGKCPAAAPQARLVLSSAKTSSSKVAATWSVQACRNPSEPSKLWPIREGSVASVPTPPNRQTL